ncbi:bifunctional serine/threonine-protein kinase/formylglycine-generating enzyme family protein [Microcoleus sp. MOSTC5]|uniref:bifunctional serine/threonine-protein kinase/formylglycine-generating enzyme family protein n=1 Tax=Microcoleus sp. MOSTC5 TaxID=3055378 RepID=UPI002FD22DC8
MICCINPDCANPQNPDGQTYCISCGVKLVPILRNRFRMIGFLGKGGFGRTYLAEDIDKLNQRCVVKQLAPNVQGTWAINKAVELFKQEARQLQQLGQHPQIPSLDAYFEENNYLYLVQQFVDGDNLFKLLQNQGIWQEKQVKQLLLELLPVLKFIHEQKIIHRDIKPENIMRRRSDGLFMLIDFGVSKELSGTVISRLGTKIGSDGYAPIEQMKGGEAYPASDLFSLGATAFHLLTGVDPYGLLLEKGYSWTENWQQYLKKLIDKGLELILSKLLAKDIQHRYQSADEVLKDFQRQSTTTSPPPPPPPPPPVPPTIISTNTTRRGFLELAVFTGGGFVLALWTQNLLNNKSSSSQTFDFETVTVNSTGQIASRSQGQARVFTENIGNGITLDMVAIPGGSFVMGSPNTEAGRYHSAGPQRSVNISPFFMGKYEVTQAQYQAVMGNNPAYFKGAKRPVEQVAWNQAVEFCRKLSQKTGKTYRLPSEAEWEYACRAGTTTPFYFGDTITPDLVNFDGTSSYGAAAKGLYRQQTTDVGSFPPNAFGLYDMHGNVWEWCADPWHDNYQGAPSDGRVWDEKSNDNRYQNYDLLVNIKNDNRTRLLRGGSWNCVPRICHSAIRDVLYPPDFDSYDFGFRVVCVAAWAP